MPSVALATCQEFPQLDDEDRLVCSELGNHFGTLLVKAGVPVRYKTYAYRWDYSYAPQMHDKYLIVDGETVATGSYNYSFTAEYDTFENVIVLDLRGSSDVCDFFVIGSGAAGGAARTTAKAKASRANGALGGRPRKTARSG